MLLYSVDPAGKWIRCHLCDTTSGNPKDIENHFCVSCGMFLDELEAAAQMCDLAFGPSFSAPRTIEFFRSVVNKLNGRGSSTHTA